MIHEFALRHIVKAATPPGSLPEGNALPYLFDERAIEQAAAGLEKLAHSDLAEHRDAVAFEPGDAVAGAVGGVVA